MDVINYPPWDHRRFTIYSELFCGMLLTFLPIFFRITSLSLPAKQPWKNMAKCVIIWINKSRLYCQNKAGYTETECIFHGTNCVPSYRSAQTHTCLPGNKDVSGNRSDSRLPTTHYPHPPDKIATILSYDIFKCIFLNENDKIPIQSSLKLVPRSPIDN